MADVIKGLSIDIGLGTAKLESGLKDLKETLKAVASEQKANMSAFDKGERSVNKYETQIKGLNKRLEAQKAVTEKARQNYEKMVQQHGEGSVQADKAAQAYNNEAAQLNNLKRYVDGVTEEMKEFKRQQEIAASGWTKFGTQMTDVGGKMKKIGTGMKDVGQKLTIGLTAPIVGLGVAASKTAIDFEAQMSRVGGIAGATAEEMKLLERSALDLGASTSKSASEVALAQEELAAMGFTVNEILGAMPGVISAAEASGAEMADTASIMASALNIFGLEASEASKVADVLAQTANVSAADINDMGYALKYAGPPAAALGVSLEELAAAVGIMTDAGMQGEQAGTTLRAALLKLLNPSEKNSKLMKKMGITVTDASGNFVGLSGIIKNLQGSMEGMTDTQKAANLASIVGTEAVSGMLSLMAAGPAEIEALTKSLENSGGASAETAAIMRDNMAGALDEMTGAFETASIEIGKVLAPAIRDVAGIIQDLTQKFIDLSPEAKKTTLVVAGVAAAIGPVLIGGGLLVSALGSIITGVGAAATAIGAAGGLTAALGTAGTAVMTFATGPVGIAITAIAALGVGAVALGKYLSGPVIEEVDIFGKKLEGVSDSTKEALSAFWELGDGVDDALIEMKVSAGKVTEEIRDEVVGNFDEMNDKILEKMNEGYEERKESLLKSFEGYRYFSDQEQQKIFEKMDQNHQIELQKQQDKEDLIKEIMDKAYKEHRELTETEEIQIQAIKTSMQDAAVTHLSESAAEEAAIRQRLKDVSGDITDEQAAELIGKAAKVRDETIKAAETEYDERVALATYMRDETGELSEDQAERLIRAAKDERDNTVREAKDKYDEIYTETVNGNEKIGDLIDKDTGEKLSKWDAYWNGVKRRFKEGNDQSIADFKRWGKDTKAWLMEHTGDALRIWATTGTKFEGKLTNMRKKASETWDNIVMAFEHLPSRMAVVLDRNKYKAVASITSMGNDMIAKFEGAVNWLIDGVNTITGKLGVKGKLDRWYAGRIQGPSRGTGGRPVATYAYGTDAHPGGPMIVGDKFGRELVEFPDGRTWLSPDTDTLIPDAPVGTRVIPNKLTEKLMRGDIPMYADGVGVLGWLKDQALSVWDYATNPSKLVGKVLSSAMSSLTGISGGAKQMASAAVTYVGKKAIDYVKSMFKKAGDFSGGKFGAPFRLTSRAGLRIHPITGLPRFHFGDDYGAPMGTPIPSQSSGVVSAAGFHVNRGNYVKVKSGVYELIYQHMQRMFAGVGDSVTKGQKLGTVGSTGASTGPHLHFEVWKNGQFVQPKSMGYATGAHFTGPTVGLMGEEDEEILIPLNPKRRTDAMKLLAIAGKMLGADNGNAKRPSSLPNVSTGNGDGTLQALLAATLKQNEILMRILQKDNNFYLNDEMVSESANRGNAVRSMLQPF